MVSSGQQGRNGASIAMRLLVVTYFCLGVSCYSFLAKASTSLGPRRTNVCARRRDIVKWDINMYLQPFNPMFQTVPMVSNSILSAPGTPKNLTGLRQSNSVFADSDTPSFPTAHGLLSPETVTRMDERMSMKHQVRDAAVTMFLDTYRRQGPMACLPMLSDPSILPKLTEAMRDIV